jgi:hypothetical protein
MVSTSNTSLPSRFAVPVDDFAAYSAAGALSSAPLSARSLMRKTSVSAPAVMPSPILVSAAGSTALISVTSCEPKLLSMQSSPSVRMSPELPSARLQVIDLLARARG